MFRGVADRLTGFGRVDFDDVHSIVVILVVGGWGMIWLCIIVCLVVVSASCVVWKLVLNTID